MITTDPHAASPASTRTAAPGLATTCLLLAIAVVIPAVAAVVLVASVVFHRPLLAKWVDGPRQGDATSTPSPVTERDARRLTLGWAGGMLLAAVLQGLGALALDASIMNPTGVTLRTLIGLAVEAVLALGTLRWRRQRTRLLTASH